MRDAQQAGRSLTRQWYYTLSQWMMGSRTDNVIEDMLDPVGLGAGED